MIEINLLPEELKKTKKTKISFLKERLWYILPAIVGLLVITHLYFAFAILVKNIQYKSLNKKWLANRPSLERVEDWRKEHSLANQDAQYIMKIIQQRIIFSDKLKKLSEVLPSGIWFNQLSIKRKDFTLQGSIVSLKDDHMSLLRGFLEQLKKDKTFSSGFISLDLGPVRMREFKGYDIMDFILEGNLK